MGHCVVWIEGVDFGETLYDTHKLSVVRGASRTLEAMPEAACLHFEAQDLKPTALVRGASIAALLVDGTQVQAEAALQAFISGPLQQGKDAEDTRLACDHIGPHSPSAHVVNAAPFAQLKFQAAVVPVTSHVDHALNLAHARVRVAQLKNPGSMVHASPVLKPCEFDHTRAVAPVRVRGPAKQGESGFSNYELSTASAARWHYGRMERQHIYDAAKINALFTDDFQTMVDDPPGLPGGEDMPLSVRNKIAVFSADGDRFGSEVIPGVIKACGSSELGNVTFTRMIQNRMNHLLSETVVRLQKLKVPKAAHVRDDEGRLLLRLETLLFGGEDVCFVVPAWLGWWLAQTFFDITSSWTITADTIREFSKKKPAPGFVPIPMTFSAGLLFANVKTPIRGLRQLADELCSNVKALEPPVGGGLDYEVLESIEPPHGGIDKHRQRFLDGSFSSVIAAAQLGNRLNQWGNFWLGDKPFPASQAHRSLRHSLAGRKLTDASHTACLKALQDYDTASGGVHAAKLKGIGCLEERGSDAFRLYQALQQRDFVRAHEVTK